MQPSQPWHPMPMPGLLCHQSRRQGGAHPLQLYSCLHPILVQLCVAPVLAPVLMKIFLRCRVRLDRHKLPAFPNTIVPVRPILFFHQKYICKLQKLPAHFLLQIFWRDLKVFPEQMLLLDL